MATSIDELLDKARLGLRRFSPYETSEAVQHGGLLIDIRPYAQRVIEGEVPFSIVIERNVLEWRLDPQSEYKIPEIAGYWQPIVIMCSEGYTSSLAAASLKQLGLTRATDLEGGFHAWKNAGFPVQPGGRPAIHELGSEMSISKKQGSFST